MVQECQVHIKLLALLFAYTSCRQRGQQDFLYPADLALDRVGVVAFTMRPLVRLLIEAEVSAVNSFLPSSHTHHAEACT